MLARRLRPQCGVYVTTTTTTLATPAAAATITTTAGQSAAREERPRRALFNVPANSDKFINKAAALSLDCVVFDLEDGVAVNRKDVARDNVVSLLNGEHQCGDLPGVEKLVRINAVGSGLSVKDLTAIAPTPLLQGIVIPKVETAADVKFVSTFLDELGPAGADVRILAAIESALGVVNLESIARADRRLDGLIFAAEDYVADIGGMRTDSAAELAPARALIAIHAIAAELQAIDIVCVDYKDEDKLRRECQDAVCLGYTGKQCIHPGQIEPVNEMFLPSHSNIEYATRIVDGDAAAGGKPFELDGKMVDVPVVKWARKILARAGEM